MKNNLLFEQQKNNKNIFFIVIKKVVFNNTRNTKNKNTLPSPNMFLVFFILFLRTKNSS